MTPTPTLYVKESLRRWEDSQGHINFGPIHERPATHDELIAAMPRCNAPRCEHWLGNGPDENPCAINRIMTHRSFGCTEHKERV